MEDVNEAPLVNQGGRKRRNPYDEKNIRRYIRQDCDGYIKILNQIYNLIYQNANKDTFEKNVINDLKKGVENDGKNDLVDQVKEQLHDVAQKIQQLQTQLQQQTQTCEAELMTQAERVLRQQTEYTALLQETQQAAERETLAKQEAAAQLKEFENQLALQKIKIQEQVAALAAQSTQVEQIQEILQIKENDILELTKETTKLKQDLQAAQGELAALAEKVQELQTQSAQNAIIQETHVVEINRLESAKRFTENNVQKLLASIAQEEENQGKLRAEQAQQNYLYQQQLGKNELHIKELQTANTALETANQKKVEDHRKLAIRWKKARTTLEKKLKEQE